MFVLISKFLLLIIELWYLCIKNIILNKSSPLATQHVGTILLEVSMKFSNNCEFTSPFRQISSTFITGIPCEFFFVVVTIYVTLKVTI